MSQQMIVISYGRTKSASGLQFLQPPNLEGSEPDFARRRTAAQLTSSVRCVHPPEDL